MLTGESLLGRTKSPLDGQNPQGQNSPNQALKIMLTLVLVILFEAEIRSFVNMSRKHIVLFL